jgi:guanosine-3',5'-bis(diphosphate) 3'-pyrophosphohydrolase
VNACVCQRLGRYSVAGDEHFFQEAPISDIALVLRAAEFAAHKHRGQRRKGYSERPYVGHCIEVAALLANVGEIEDPEILAAALLHDTVEDTETTHDELVKEFGQVIAGYVAEVTDDKGLESDVRKELQVQHAPHLSRGAKLIKLGDKISNVREIGEDPPKQWSEERRRKYFAWAKRVVDAMETVNTDLENYFARTFEESSRKLTATGHTS